jgi:hypothetical protein
MVILIQGWPPMKQSATKVNPSEEAIKIGPLGIRFLLTGDDSNGSVSAFELFVPIGQKLIAPAHKTKPMRSPFTGLKAS